MAGERILVVEDNEKNMKLVRDILQVTGYEPLEASSGEQAHVLGDVVDDEDLRTLGLAHSTPPSQ